MDSEKLTEQWQGVCAQVKSYPDTDASQVDAFFSRLEPQAMSDSFLMLTADNSFIKDWVEKNYLDVIKRALLDLRGVNFTVALAVDEGQEQRKAAAAYQQPAPALAPTAPAAVTPAAPGAASYPTAGAGESAAPYMPHYDESKLPDHYSPQPPASQATEESQRPNGVISSLTFGNFVIGDSNRMAYSMAVEVAESPGRTPLNPLFIYGRSGLGKTHLMRAIQNYVQETRPQLRAVYVDSKDFLAKYTDAAVSHDREKASFKNFNAFYEEADVLLIDDLQELQGKTRTLDMVFQLFNTLTQQGKQVVLSADRAPRNIDVDERYQSRFNSGGVTQIEPPEIETKLGVVKSYINTYSQNEGFAHLTVPDAVQLYIAEESGSNIRELKSAITKVIYQMMLSGRNDITLEETRMLLQDHFTGGASRNLTVDDIQRVVESFFKVSHSDLVGPKRPRSIAYPRHIAIYLCRQLLDIPYQDIGEKFNRDHTTAMHSVEKVEEMMAKDRAVQEELEVLNKMILDL